MCGISCCYKCRTNIQTNKRLLNRGPDHQHSIQFDKDVTLTACVLYIQGNCKQPLSKDHKHLIYNGQLFQYPQVWWVELFLEIPIWTWVFSDSHQFLNVPHQHVITNMKHENILISNSLPRAWTQVYKSDTDYLMEQVFSSGILSAARLTIGHGPTAVIIYDVSILLKSYFTYNVNSSSWCFKVPTRKYKLIAEFYKYHLLSCIVVT